MRWHLTRVPLVLAVKRQANRGNLWNFRWIVELHGLIVKGSAPRRRLHSIEVNVDRAELGAMNVDLV